MIDGWMGCILVVSKYFPVVTHASYVMFLFNPAATLLNLPPTVGYKYPNDESTTYDHTMNHYVDGAS